MKQGEMKELNVIVKADVQGSVEALAASLKKIDVEGVNIKIIHTAARRNYRIGYYTCCSIKCYSNWI